MIRNIDARLELLRSEVYSELLTQSSQLPKVTIEVGSDPGHCPNFKFQGTGIEVVIGHGDGHPIDIIVYYARDHLGRRVSKEFPLFSDSEVEPIIGQAFDFIIEKLCSCDSEPPPDQTGYPGHYI